MADYWFDANIFIESHRRAYAFDIAPGFWHWISKIVFDGRMRVPKIIWDEVCRGERDQLARFLQMMPVNPSVTANSAVTKLQGEIGDYVINKYRQDRAYEFIRSGDSWLIAHAMECKGTVVTYEGPGFGTGGKIQIPEVCKGLGVTRTDIYSASRSLGLKLLLYQQSDWEEGG